MEDSLILRGLFTINCTSSLRFSVMPSLNMNELYRCKIFVLVLFLLLYAACQKVTQGKLVYITLYLVIKEKFWPIYIMFGKQIILKFFLCGSNFKTIEYSEGFSAGLSLWKTQA